MSWIFLFQIILYYIILSIFYLLSILYKKSLTHWQKYIILYKIYINVYSQKKCTGASFFWECYIYCSKGFSPFRIEIKLHRIYIDSYTITIYTSFFIKSFYMVVTKARFARRPTGGRPYTLTIQKYKQNI